MENKLQKNKIEILNYGLLLITFCLLALSIILHPKVADDFCLASAINDSNSFKDYIINYYNGTNGRLFSGTFYYLFFYNSASTIFCKLISALLLFYLVNVVCKQFLKTTNKTIFLFYFVLVYCIIWFGFPAINETIYWSNASIVYLWGLAFFIFFITPFFNYLLEDNIVKNKANFINYLIPIIALIAGFIQEQLLLPATTVFGFLLLKNFKQKSLKQIPITVYLAIISFYTGFALMVFSPANLTRFASTINNSAAGSSSKAAVIFRIYDYVVNTFIRIDGSSIIPWLLAVIFIVLYIFKAEIKFKKNIKFLIFFTMALGAILPIFLTGCKNTAPRTYFYFSFFFVLAILSLINNYTIPSSTKLISRLTFLLLFLIVIDTFNATRSSYYYYKQNSDREKLITINKKANTKIIELTPFFSKLHRAMYVKDVNKDKDDIWINECVCNYYKINSINVINNK